jgi:hypothetical protein
MSHSGWPHYQESLDAQRRQTGVVITAFIPSNTTAEDGRAMLRSTSQAFLRELERPEALCLAADGPGPAAGIVRDLASETGALAVVTDRHLGKLSAQRSGAQALLRDNDLQYLACADQDGDHFANELLNLIRAARHVQNVASTDKIMVIGRRISRHRAMGFLRGELEELADRVLLDALQYHAATSGNPLPLQFALTMDEFPDFHSGYKLFTRKTAEDVFAHGPELMNCSEECYYKHAVEAVISTEAALSGATLVSVNRSSFDEQPVSGFGLLDRRQLVADKIIWPCRRLGIPPAFVAQWIDNHLPRLLLGTLIPEGRDELLGIRRLVLDAFGLPAPDDRIVRPEFI